MKLRRTVRAGTSKHRMGVCVVSRCSASVSTRFVTKIEARLKKIQYVTKVKVSGEGAPSGTTKSAKDKCTSDRLLDERGVKVMNVSL